MVRVTLFRTTYQKIAQQTITKRQGSQDLVDIFLLHCTGIHTQ
jgi:hypothetical protein